MSMLTRRSLGLDSVGLLALVLSCSQTLAEGQELKQQAAIADQWAESDPEAVLPADDEADDTGLDDLDDLLDADLGQLARAEIAAPVFGEEVTTVARQESTVGRSPAAVYVITNEMIRRSGVRSIPEALRLAPGVQVAKIDANKWAISIRGFNQRFANKLLVQIDGRTVYTPLFAGVFWDVQDVLLEDVDRIEIVRGPGASMWGANAVNGIINIITKSSYDTSGVFAEAGGGDERAFTSARIGQRSGRSAWRAYGKWFDRDGGVFPGDTPGDDWEVGRVGFRADYQPSCADTLTLQGDYYDGDAGQNSFTPTLTSPFVASGVDNQQITGGNVLTRWTRKIDDDSNWALQLFYDRTERTIDNLGFREDRDTVDLDWQHRFRWRPAHSVIWGLGYRNTRDRIRNGAFNLQFEPDRRSDDTFSTFVQDEMTLLDDLLYFTVGSKFSWNDYTGFEYQPTGRLLYTPSNRQSIWASVSRAVRTPSRASDDIRAFGTPVSTPVFPTFPVITGSRAVESEQLLSWEVGMRSAPTDEFFWDLTTFYNEYRDVQSIFIGTPAFDAANGVLTLPLNVVNALNVDTYGFELASTAKVNSRWTIRGGYSFIKINTRDRPPETANDTPVENENPRNQLFFHSSHDLGRDVEFDLMGRYVDSLALSEGGVPSYVELDFRVAWQPSDTFEVALVGRNLLDSSHPEFGNDTVTGALATETQRELFGSATWRY